MVDINDIPFHRLTMFFRMEIRALLCLRLDLLYRDAVSIGERIAPDAGHRPGNLAAHPAAGDSKSVVLDLALNVKPRARRSHRS